MKTKWKWAGHTAREKHSRWTIRTTEMQPRKEKPARHIPMRQLHSDITNYAGALWTVHPETETETEGHV